MNKKIENLINAAVMNIIDKCSSNGKIKKLEDTHSKKYTSFLGDTECLGDYCSQ